MIGGRDAAPPKTWVLTSLEYNDMSDGLKKAKLSREPSPVLAFQTPDSGLTTSALIAVPQAGWRSDRALCAVLKHLNRRAAKHLFRQRQIRLNGKTANGSERVKAGDRLEFPDPNTQASKAVIDKAIAPRLATAHGRQIIRIFEDESILVISKPAEIPVHRGQGELSRRDTLEDVLNRAYPPRNQGSGVRGQGSEPQYFFIHRLDMETSGCLLVAKSAAVRDALLEAFSQRKIHKEYLAFVAGEVSWDKQVVTRPITYIREPNDSSEERTHAGAFNRYRSIYRKAVMPGQKVGMALEEGDPEGKACETHFKTLLRYKGYSLLLVLPKTGRTHQIRIHLRATGHALVYDPLYGRRTPIRLRELDIRSSESERGEEVVLNRLPLHAWKISFVHPVSGEQVKFEAPLPRDLKEFLKLLKKFRGRDQSC